MNDIEFEIFGASSPDRDLLVRYGFAPDGDMLRYGETIVDGDFEVTLTFDGETLNSRVIDLATEEEYLPIFAESHVGSYVGRVREEYAECLRRIADTCFVRTPFRFAQSNRVARAIADTYGESEDRPFATAPEHAVFRYPRSNKWYAIVMLVKKSAVTKIASDDEMIEVINVKTDPAEHSSLLGRTGFYPAYHMSRKSWISVILDGTVDDGEIMRLIGISRAFAVGHKSASSGESVDGQYIIPSNPAMYDIDEEITSTGELMWHQPKSIKVGDTVYIYSGSPHCAVRYKCEVVDVDIPCDYDTRLQMILRPTVRYDDDYCMFDRLQALGIKAVRSARRVTVDFVEYMDRYESRR